MSTTYISLDDAALIARADAAAGARRLGEALGLLHQVIDRGSADADTFLKASSLHRAQSEPRIALDLITRALRLDPLNFLALMFRADLLYQLGDPSAAEVYGQALAQRGEATLHPPLQAAVDKAEKIYAAYKQSSRAALETTAAPYAAQGSSLEQKRLARFASNIARETRPHHCDPTNFHFPGLAEYEFHDRAAFPWLDEVEASTAVIREELDAVLGAERAELVPYVQYDDAVPMRQWKGLNHNLDWTAVHLIARGERVEANARHCPRTMALLSRLPQPDLVGDAPNAMFSLLKPRTAIPPHHGIANFRLVCHLPLIVPPNCWFRVGAETREWEVGKAFVFDDTMEHEAANDSDELRVVMIFDVWHPGLSALERSAIQAMLAGQPAVGTL